MLLPSRVSVALASALIGYLPNSSRGFNSSPRLPLVQRYHCSRDVHGRLVLSAEEKEAPPFLADGTDIPTRRNFLASLAPSALATTALVGSSSLFPTLPARAEGVKSKSTADAAVTDKIFIVFKGLSAPSADGTNTPDRITIGLFGDDAPQPTSIIKKLVTKEGFKSKCKPLDTSRLLQKEQLEANKVYNSCLENEDTVGVNYDYSTVWRVIKDERIDVGAVSGKFVARENPNFEDSKSGLVHDAPGVVSVRRGDESGYSFTIFPGGSYSSALDEDNIVIGRVVEGMDIVDKLNNVPVVKNAGIKLTGGAKAKNAPSRGCRYGGSEYFCSEDKPLKKILLDETGLM